MSTPKDLRKRALRINRELGRLYPDAHCALHYETPLQLLIATMLSAQCTDVRVNQITPALFKRYPNAYSFADADTNDLEEMIHSTGFFRNKTKNIIACCQALVDEHRGEVPDSMDELVPLPGVGRKTANVILGEAFAVPGITVDTHMKRLGKRLGLTTNTNPNKIERDLMALLPKKQWTPFSHRMIFHGRQVCHARKPACDGCSLKEMCPKVGVKKTDKKKKPD